MHAQTSHPVVMAEKCMQVLSCLQDEQIYQLVSTASQDKRLIVVTQTLRALLGELFQSIHSSLTCKFMLQEFRAHQFATMLAFDEMQCLYNIIMCKKT